MDYQTKLQCLHLCPLLNFPFYRPDEVIWSDNPLSINARVEKTFIDGILFYDLEKSYDMYQRDQEDRKRLTALMLDAKNGGAQTQKPVAKTQLLYHCDTMGDEDSHDHQH